jgi:hypothetical protein
LFTPTCLPATIGASNTERIMATNPDRHSLQAQLARAYSDLESAKAEYARQALRLAQQPKDADAQHHVVELEAEIAGHRRTIARLEAAQQAEQQQTGEQLDADRTAEIKALCDKCVTISDQLDPLLEQIVEHLDAVGPTLAEYVALAAQRNQAAHAAARLAYRGKPVPALLANCVRIDGHGALVNALIGGVVRAGIGTVGPSLGPHVVVSAPVRPPTLADAQITLARDRARLDEAIKLMTQPKTTTEEQPA